MRAAHLAFSNQTVREIVHVSIGGSSVRVRLSNANNRQLVNIGAAHLGLRAKDSAEADQSDRQLTFGGRTNVLLPADGVVISDPVSLPLPPGSDLAISLYIPGEAMAGGIHYGALQTSYIGSGDMTSRPEIADAQALNSWVFLAGVDVMAPAAAAAVVTFGDSITDGTRSTPNTNRRWPNVLDARLRGAQAKGPGIGVVNEGYCRQQSVARRHAHPGSLRSECAGKVRPRCARPAWREVRHCAGGHQRHRLSARRRGCRLRKKSAPKTSSRATGKPLIDARA